MPRNEIKLGKILGVEIGLDYSWFWIFALITFLFSTYLLPSFDPNRSVIAYVVLAILGSILFFSSVLVHELAHTFVARRNKLPVNKITLFLFGGVSNLVEEPKNPKVELKVAIAGPISSVLIGVFLLVFTSFYLRANNPEMTVLLVQYIGFVNLLLAVFNMLPGFPLDGGRVLRALLWLKYKNLLKATKTATTFGKWVAFLLIGYGILELIFFGIFGGIWLVLIGFFLLQAATLSYGQAVATEVLKGVTVKEVMNEPFEELQGEATINELEALSLKKHIKYFVIMESGKITGLISTKILTKYSKDQWILKTKELGTPIEEIPSIDVDAEINEAYRAFSQFRNMTALPVFENNNFVGLISLNDIDQFIKVKASEV